ncbi:MAG TPA: aspartate-semialdehyde dehydrogenase [Dehalococcoidia bacterium]|jgi:aspartate-semialdehyde dehydrogenase|nr:aspartate-semialdehyde dehydrogenase [Dehalococcoidia bacterium]
MTKSYNVAVVGATGIVGQELLGILVKRSFPVRSLKLLASPRSAGKKIPFGEQELEVEALTHSSFEGCDLVFNAIPDETSKEYSPSAVKAGAIVIDKTGAWRMDPDVPLVVPEINGADVEQHKGIIATPNCATTPVVMALWPVHRVNPVKRIVAATYQSVSGTGGPAVTELRSMTRQVLDEQPVTPDVYPHQIAFNLIPEIGSWKDEDYTSEEMKLVNETRKIFHEPNIAITATCVRVPTFVSHAAAVFAELSEPMAADKVREVMASQPGVVIQDDPRHSVYPQPWEAAGEDPVYVGRIRRDLSHPNGIAFWTVGDNLRKGAALNALQIAEELIARNVI